MKNYIHVCYDYAQSKKMIKGLIADLWDEIKRHNWAILFLADMSHVKIWFSNNQK